MSFAFVILFFYNRINEEMWKDERKIKEKWEKKNEWKEGEKEGKEKE